MKSGSVPESRECPNCGSRVTKKARFCPECGVRLDEGGTVVQEVPLDETGPVPIELTSAAPRFFGVTPPAAVLALGAASLALAVVMLVAGHTVVGGVLLAVAGILFALFAALARRLPDTPAARLSLGAMSALRARAGFAVEALAVHSSARVELFRLRRELLELAVERAECARVFGEAVYADDTEPSETARARMAELDGLIAAKEEAMEQTASGAMERLQHAQLQVQPTQIETPEPPSPEPYPEPTPPPEPVPMPEPTPEPSEPPGPVRIPEPGPEPSPPAQPQG
jgi:zinc-ribbon domain